MKRYLDRFAKQHHGMSNGLPDIERLASADNANDAVATLSVAVNMIEGDQSIVCVKRPLFLPCSQFLRVKTKKLEKV